MKKVIVGKWAEDEKNIGGLYFVQRLDEMLFYYTLDTYKASLLNTKILLSEFLTIRRKIEEGLLNEKNDEAVLQELLWSMENDAEFRDIVGQEVVDHFKKSVGSLSINDKVKAIRFLWVSVSGKVYINKIIEKLKVAIIENKNKEIERLTRQFVCELQNCGYNPQYIYKQCHNHFCAFSETNFSDRIDNFFGKFDCKKNCYNVFLDINEEIGEVCLKLIRDVSGLEVEILENNRVPVGITVPCKGNKIIKISKLEELDEFSAFDTAKKVVNIMSRFYSFYRHNITNNLEKGYYQKDEEKITLIKPSVGGIKRSTKAKSLMQSVNGAVYLFDLARTNEENFYFLSRIMEIHSISVEMDAPSNSLLDLWSILELLLENDKESSDKSRVYQIIDMVVPFLINAYIVNIISTLSCDLEKWNKKNFERIMSRVNLDIDIHCKLFAFITLDEYKEERNKLYGQLSDYPLLRFRIFSLNEQFKDKKSIARVLTQHEKKITWHILRIYRARNCIIHDGEDVDNVDGLVENLHSYVDTLCEGLIKLLSRNNSRYGVSDAIYEMKLREKLYIEFINNNEITSDNIEKFFQF